MTSFATVERPRRASGRMLSALFRACLLAAFCQASLTGTLSAGTAPLWIPADQAPLEDVIARLESDPGLKLTAALGEIPASLLERISALSSAGRLEISARPAGDPVLPLFYYPGEEAVKWADKPSSAPYSNDPFFLSLRMSQARDSFSERFKKAPSSLVSPPGGVVPACLPLAKALGFKWLAAGTPAAAAPAPAVIEADGVKLVLFSTAAADQWRFPVFDETTPGANDRRAALLSFLASPGAALMTVSEALASEQPEQLPPGPASMAAGPWSGDYSPWAASGPQSGALSAFARTRGELMEHFNSGQGDFKAVGPAFSEYFSAESGPKLVRLSDPDPEIAHEAEIEIQNSLANSYRLMGKVPPGWLFSALSDLSAGTEPEDKVSVRRSSDGFSLVNTGRRPVPPENASGGAQDPYRAWKLSEVSVSWNEEEAVFRFSPLEGAANGGLPPGASFELYMDVNNRPRAGHARLLDGRPGRIYPDDAWEYALSAAPKKAELYAATGRGPKLVKTFTAVLSEGTLSVKVPRNSLRGNPERWGYAAFMLDTQDDTTFHISDFLAEELAGGYYYAVRPSKK